MKAATPPSESIYLQELDPSTTYYYEIVASGGSWTHDCYNGGSLTGSFTTTASSTAPNTFTGTVFDQNGNPAPANMGIVIFCDPDNFDYNWGLTNSAGAYSIQMPTMCIQAVTSYTLDLENPCPNASPGCGGAITWPGHWNETITTYVPGHVDFYLEDNSNSYVPTSVAFLHVSTAQLSYSTSVYSSNENTWNYAGWEGSTLASAYMQISGPVSVGASVLLEGEFVTTGTAVFEGASARQLAISALTYLGQVGSREVQTGTTNPSMWTDWEASAPSGGYCDAFASSTQIFKQTLSTQYTTGSGYDFSKGVSAGPSWANVGVSVPIQNTLQATSGQSTTITVSLPNPNSPNEIYYDIYMDGQNAANNPDNIVMHVWQVSSC
jgi:hypothetical protein